MLLLNKKVHTGQKGKAGRTGMSNGMSQPDHIIVKIRANNCFI